MTDPLPRRRRPALWPLAILVALLIGGPLVTWLSTGSDDDGRLGITEGVDSYRISYLVEDLAGGGSVASTEIVTVRRPFDSRVEILEGRPPGGDRVSLTLAGFAAHQRTSGPDPMVITVEPGPPPGDVRVDANLAAAIARGLLADTGTRREIEGRRCDVYRTPVLSPAGRDEGDDRELCIDEAGLVLSDELTVGGKPLRRRTATSVEIEPAAVPDDAFALTGQSVPVADGGGAIREVTPDSRTNEATVYELLAAPEGFRHRGRFALTPATPISEEGLVPSGVRIVGVIDVWTKGRDYVAVFNGGADDEADPFPDSLYARSANLGTLDGETVVSLAGAEVRADLGAGRFVRVYGTVPLTDLLALARRLEPIRGGAITPSS